MVTQSGCSTKRMEQVEINACYDMWVQEQQAFNPPIFRKLRAAFHVINSGQDHVCRWQTSLQDLSMGVGKEGMWSRLKAL